jgi:tetratricopeptide (TPR) repeat protein
MNIVVAVGCLGLSLGLALAIAPTLLEWSSRRQPVPAGVVETTRGLLGWYCLQKADDYFHSGALGTAFDRVNEAERTQALAAAGDVNALLDDHWISIAPHLGPPLDWLDDFSRHFYPTRHTHLNDGGASGRGQNLVHEILPWFWFAAAVNPHEIEAYLEAAYWLRRDGRHLVEAEAFLRRGLRANPRSYEISFELGRIFEEDRDAPPVARIYWESALCQWDQCNAGRKMPDTYLLRCITGRLARLEERQGNYEQALRHGARLKPFSATPAKIESWMQQLRAKLSSPTTAPAPIPAADAR